MAGQWEVYTGCDEWQDVDQFDDEAMARKCYDDHIDNWPTMGLYPADVVYLRDPAGKTVEIDDRSSDRDDNSKDSAT